MSSDTSLTSAWDTGAFSTPTSIPAIGEVLADRYELRSELGAGSYGQVFAAWDRVRARMIAVKILRDARQESLLQFKQEFRALNELRHKNLVRLLKLGRTNDLWFIVMELVEGAPITVANNHSPKEFSEEQRRHAMATTVSLDTQELSPPPSSDSIAATETLRIGGLVAPLFCPETLRDRIGQLAEGIRTLHRYGIIHCDLKPSNVMVTPEGRVVILDFGVAKYTMRLGAHLQRVDAHAGTRAYMAPELGQLEAATPGLDWYALGMMLAELLTGHSPSDLAKAPYDALRAVLLDAAKRHEEHAPFYELCVQLLHPDPKQRADHNDVFELCFPERASDFDKDGPKRTHVFAGRTEELRVLQTSLDQFLAGTPTTLIVEGRAGIGKTTLCNEFLRRTALQPNAPYILVARCKNDELLGFRAFDELVDGIAAIMRTLPDEELAELLPFCTPALASLFPTLRPFNESAEVNWEEESPEDALYALRALLTTIAQQHRLIIWVEDLHQADRDSLRWIARIFAPGLRPNVFLLLSKRPTHAPTEDTVDIDTLGYAVPTLRLKTLSRASSREVLLSWLPPKLRGHRTLLERLLSIGQGHPYMLRELSRYADRMAELSGNTTLTSMLTERLKALPRTQFDVLCAIATSFETPSRVLLEHVTEQSPAVVDEALEALEELAFLVPAGSAEDELYDIAHAAIRECVNQLMEHEVHQQLHARYAQAGIDGISRPMRPTAIVAHLVRADNPAAAKSYASELATASDRSGAYEIAAQMYELLIQVGRDQGSPPSAELRLRAVECQLRTGRLVDAANLLIELAEEAPAAEASALRRRAAETYILSGHIDEGNRQLELSRPPSERNLQLPLPRALRVGLFQARLRRRLLNLDPEETTLDELDEVTAALMSSYRMSGVDIGMIDAIKGLEFTMRELDLALDLKRRGPIAFSLAAYSAFVSMSGGKQEQEARQWVALAIQMAETLDDPLILEWARICEATIDYHHGEYRSAWDRIAVSFAWVEKNASHQAMVLSYLEGHRLFCTNLFGETDLQRAAYYGQIVEARARNNRMMEASVTLTGINTWLIDDAPEAARAAVHRARLHSHRAGHQLYDFFYNRSLLELCLYEQRALEYDRHIQIFRRFEATMLSRSVELVRHEIRLCHGRLMMARAKYRGHLPRADRLLLHMMAKTMTTGETPLSRGAGHHLLAGAYALSGDKNRAAFHLGQTVEIFAAAEVNLFAETARAAGKVAGFFPSEGDPYRVLFEMGVVNPARLVRSHHPYI